MGRAVLEWQSRQGAGILDETDDWYWVKVLGSFEMYVMKSDKSVTPHLVHEGFWESWITQYIKERIGPGTVFFDIGANTGYYSLLAYYCGAMVDSYEPNPRYYEMMHATKARNGITGLWHIHNVAISDRAGTETLWVPKQLHGSASFTKLADEHQPVPMQVQTQTLNVNGAGHYLIKIDAEGAEEKITDGFLEDLKRRIGPSEVLLEYTPGAYSPEFLDKLKSYAPLYWINGHAEAEPVTDEWVYSQTDWVMLTLNPRRGRL